jgi:hypothetical protein
MKKTALYLLGVILVVALPCAAAPHFESTGSLANAHTWHTETLLNNGKVLVAGSYKDGGYAANNCQLYDPATGCGLTPAG